MVMAFPVEGWAGSAAVSVSQADDGVVLDTLDDAGWAEITDRWRPYRMWATVLLRVGWERARPGRSYRDQAR
jgi:hypothetical protein